ncbi:MAG: thiolase domain-containing protein [Thermoplasmata archaeon]|nr:thiolase domain-containing protein [Thermoplasmata archaeon]MCI4359991.1 thiolase domain-containing protein [Thermoplasmata archaeon]
MRETWVIGAATSRFGKLTETGREAASRVALQAVDSAGIDPKRIGYTFVSNCFGVAEHQAHLGPLVNTALGIPEVPSATIESACSSSSAGLHEAYLHVASGLDDAVLVVGAERLSHLDTLRATSYFAMGADYPFETRNGATFPGLYATLANAHQKRFGTRSEELGAVAVKNHANGARNPNAHFQKEISLSTYLASPVIASPLRLYDCCPFSDGASALVVAAREAFPRPPSEPLVVRASVRSGSIADLHDRPDMTGLPASRVAGEKAFRMAKLLPNDIDFAEVHDCFTIAEVMALEDLGFFPKGEAARAAVEGTTAIDGRFPVNPSGGLKAKGHPVSATGAAQVVEVFEQFNQRAGRRAVPRTRTALTHNVGATGGSCSVHIFSRRDD